MLFGLVRNMVTLTSMLECNGELFKMSLKMSIIPPICPGRRKGIVVCNNQGILPYRG